MKNIRQPLLLLFAVSVSIAGLLFIVTCAWIGYEVRSVCHSAIRKYGDDCTPALVAQLEDERNDYRERNDAIWALGQLGDARALPTLQKYYTGNIPAREPLDTTISQYELKKAINLAGGGINISAFIWRGLISIR